MMYKDDTREEEEFMMYVTTEDVIHKDRTLKEEVNMDKCNN